jgi:hypothetical protein
VVTSLASRDVRSTILNNSVDYEDVLEIVKS